MIPHRSGIPNHGEKMRKDRVMEKERIDLESIAGGAGEEKKYYRVEGYAPLA